MEIVRANEKHLAQLAPLLDGYRVFYRQPSDLKAATGFLKERFLQNDSIIFLARTDDRPAGFLQLYPSFSTVSMQALMILNDLYVHPDFRGKGIGKALLRRAQELASENGLKGLALETAVDNPARHLYESLGWERDTHCFHYFWQTKP
ncbi:GNAT family N-acetyltransferase [Robiginitalea sediminis]|uniref:GNAT family N-acetyltransferase n=1 Tax=Robiginitalea sediminis TaxID=1982593 RepID=UPI000B4C1FF7|nr:GNAT family N-acetyltransferase [Robiginitalea sediminis]